MLEHSTMLYGAVSPPMLTDEDVVFPDFYTRLGPCELQDPCWVKMSAVAAGATKKRKKSDTKPQAQINKCNNEKRRREQENIYIEELAELISANFGDMSSLSVKPDKCAILQETVNQIRNIKAREEAATSGPGGAGPGQPDAVQQGEVSSSRPTILANEVIAPLLLEALDGFLFVVSAEGKVEFVTDNVATYIKFSREEVLGKSVYNIIHHGDHARFSTTLLPSISWGSGASGSSQTNDTVANNQNTAANNNSRSRSFYCRLLIKPPDDQDETMEERQTRSNHYEQMHISSTQLPYNHASGGGMGSVGDAEDGSNGDPGPCLMCLARRVPQCEKATGSSIEQFTTKLDTNGKIVGIDTSGVSANYSSYLNKDLMGRVIQELCLQQELHKLTSHLKETVNTGQGTSEIYRLRISSPDKYIRVQTKSKLFKNNPPDEDFIMATHSIIGEHEPQLELDSGNVAGPLMPSVMNGTRNGVPTSRFSGSVSAASDGGSSATSSNNSLTPTSSASYAFTLNTDLDFDFFPTSTWGELGGTAWTDAPPRPDSCASVTPVSTPTPRPPSAPVYSPAPPALPSPFAAQPSPSAAAPTPATNPYSSTFPFSPMQEPTYPADEPAKDTKENVLEEASAMAESGRLRNLLTKPPASSSDSSNDAEVRNKHQILKDLLNQKDDEDNRSDNRTSPRGLVGGRSNAPGNGSSGPGPSPGQPSGSADQPKHANNMLLRLLNEKSDDDDLEHRAGLKKRSELLQQLLKEQDEEHKAPEPAAQGSASGQTQDDALLRSLGFPLPPSPSSGEMGPGKARKRPSDERDDLMAKRPNDNVQVSSSGPSVGTSKLCEKNKMLARLLAKQTSCTPIPHIPASVISATPQEKLPRVKNDFGLVTSQAGSTVSDSRTSAGRGRMPGRPPQTSYLNQILTPGGDGHMQNAQHLRQPQSNRGQFTQMDTNTYATPAPTSTEIMWDLQSSDPLLSDILDSVIDIVPDAVISDSSAIMNLLDAIESPQNNNNFHQHQAMNEKMAINAIQKSLMQCESAVKSPSSPTISLPSTPPAYSQAMTSVQTSQHQTTAGGFPPPPVYQRPNPGGQFQLQQQRPGVQSVRPGAGGQYQMPPGQQQQLLIQQRKLLQQQQQEHKRRLLQQQQQQQLLIPSNAAASELNQGLQNIDNLINNTVAPNVTLQRSSSVPDSQLSPGYNNSMMNVNNNNQGQRQPYSPHSQMASPLNQQQQQQQYPTTPVSVNNFQQGGARLSPHPPFQQQLSPRQSYPPGQQPNQPTTWAQTQVANRLSLQQQQNPMLNAQLTGTYNNTNRGFQVQRQQQQQQQQRAIGSPGSAQTRQSPFPAETFPPPASPTSGFNQSQFQQQMRLQRTISAPTATTQLPGGLGSPRPYVGRGDHPPGPGPGPLHSPYPAPHPPPHPHQHQHPMMYQQDSQYCYDQASLQLAYNGADRGRGPPPHLQGGGAGTGNGMNATSEYVRQELRAVVGARTGQAPPSNVRQQQQVSPSDLEALGLSYEMSNSGASDSPKLWGTMGSDMGSMSPQPPPTLSSSSRTTTEEMGRQGDQKSSLLQKLLSE